MSLSPSVPEGGERFQTTRIFSPENQLFLLSDTDKVRENVSRVFKPHELQPSQSGEGVSACMHHVSRGRLSLNRLEYSTDVIIDPGRLERFYLIQIPMAGNAEVRCGNHRFDSTPQVASLLSPQLPVEMRWQGGAPQLAIRIDSDDMAHHCRQHLAQHPEHLPAFDPRLDLGSTGGAYFLQLLGVLLGAMADEQHPIHQPLVLRQFESALLNALLYGVQHDVQQQLHERNTKSVSPYFVKRTEEYIRNHLHEPLSIECLAEQAGVSVRTLYAGFRNFRNTSPMAYLRDLRLERVHQELAQEQQSSVTEVAFKWGFAHLGRFAQEYKRRYGELPSATLRYRNG